MASHIAMVDHVDPQRRSSMMRAVRGKNTRPEIVVRRAAHRLGLRFRLHEARLPGRPDLVFPKWRVALFVNGCFWHQHEGCKRSMLPKSNADFWSNKLDQNARRDAKNYEALASKGWRVAVIWECEVATLEKAAARISEIFDLKPIGPNALVAKDGQVYARRRTGSRHANAT